jgi:predicted lactoylglutathione lyase
LVFLLAGEYDAGFHEHLATAHDLFASAESVQVCPPKTRLASLVEGRMPVAISCVTIPVDDLKKSLAFYRDGLGLTPEEMDEDHAAFDVDGVYLTLLDRSGFGAYVEQVGNRPASRGNAGMIISYFADSKADVDAIMARAQKAGATISAAHDDEDGYTGYFADPDGHTWEVLYAE